MRKETNFLQSCSSEVLRELQSAYFREARSAAKRIRENSDKEALHDIRVSIRRVRSLLKTYRDLFEKSSDFKAGKKRLSALLEATNRVRDTEITAQWLRRCLEAVSGEDRQALRSILAVVEEERDSGYREVRSALSKRGAVPRLKIIFNRRAEKKFASTLPPLLLDADAEFASALEKIRGSAADEKIHRARLSAKRFRYLIEPLRGINETFASTARDLGDLQTLLGDLHDLAVVEERLVEFGRQAGEQLVKRSAGSSLPAVELELQARLRVLGLVARRCAELKEERFAKLKELWLSPRRNRLAPELLKSVHAG